MGENNENRSWKKVVENKEEWKRNCCMARRSYRPKKIALRNFDIFDFGSSQKYIK